MGRMSKPPTLAGRETSWKTFWAALRVVSSASGLLDGGVKVDSPETAQGVCGRGWISSYGHSI
jgi:hypothetical protein